LDWLFGEHKIRIKQSLFVVMLPMLPLDTYMSETVADGSTCLGSLDSITLESLFVVVLLMMSHDTYTPETVTVGCSCLVILPFVVTSSAVMPKVNAPLQGSPGANLSFLCLNPQTILQKNYDCNLSIYTCNSSYGTVSLPALNIAIMAIKPF
jgi:hypothetical protein